MAYFLQNKITCLKIFASFMTTSLRPDDELIILLLMILMATG